MTTREPYKDYIGRTSSAEQVIAAAPVNALSVTIERDVPSVHDGDPVPPGWHDLYFRSVAPLTATGKDGHPRRGSFMPPVPLQRMMWAGNSMTFHRPLYIGERARRVSRIAAIDEADGVAGPVVRVTLHNEISGESGLAISEVRSSVFRDPPPDGAPPSPEIAIPTNPSWQQLIHPNPVLLYRFSALTLNSHRIHYDRSYATEVEGYPGLVFHGSLTLLLLMELFRKKMPDAKLHTFTGEAISPRFEPLYDTMDVTLLGERQPSGGDAHFWARRGDGVMTMLATATF